MKQRSRAKVANKQPIPFRFELPRDTQEVRFIAVAASMNEAFFCASGQCICKKNGLVNHGDAPDQLALAFHFAQLYSNTEYDRKRGTNDEQSFRSIFSNAVPRAYLGFLDFLQRSPDALAILADLPRNDRLATFNTAAMAQIHLLEVPANDPFPLTWPAPAQKSEVE